MASHRSRSGSVQNTARRQEGDSAKAKRVCILYGRDLGALAELTTFLEALGLEVEPFERHASRLGAAPFVGDVVTRLITQADAVVALLTPDESAVLYDPSTGS